MSYANRAFRPKYTKRIKSLETLLWVLCGAAVICVFVLTTSKPSADRFLLNNSELMALALGEQITDPTFTGVTNGNDAFSVGAEAAIPDGARPTRVDLVSPSTSIEFNSGLSVFARADNGAFDIENRAVSLSGGAIITSTDGYRIDSQKMVLNLKETVFSASDGVMVQSGNTEITAQSVVIETNDQENFQKDFVLRFQNGVKFVHTPTVE